MDPKKNIQLPQSCKRGNVAVTCGNAWLQNKQNIEPKDGPSRVSVLLLHAVPHGAPNGVRLSRGYIFARRQRQSTVPRRGCRQRNADA